MKYTLSLLKAGAIALLFTGCSEHKDSGKIPGAINVTMINLSTQKEISSDKIICSGTLQADKMIDLSFQVSGTLDTAYSDFQVKKLCMNMRLVRLIVNKLYSLSLADGNVYETRITC